MSSFIPRPFRVFSNIAFALAEPPQPESRKFYNYIEGDDLVAPQTDTMNLVLSRNLRKNVQISADMAIGIAKQEKDGLVVYVNSYAGNRLMQSEWRSALGKHGFNATKLLPDDEAADPTLILPNMAIIDAPIGKWDPEPLRLCILGDDKHPAPSKSVILLFNSFEYAALDRVARMKLAQNLVELQSAAASLTMLIFSNELRSDVFPHHFARGPIGVLAGESETVWRIKDEYERLKERKIKQAQEAKARKRAGIGVVHENQTYKSSSYVGAGPGGMSSLGLPMDKNGKVIAPSDRHPAFPLPLVLPDGTQYDDYLPEWMDYIEDPWKGEDSRPSEYLTSISRDPLLKQFYIDKPGQIFGRGFQPTAWGLRSREADRMIYGIPKLLPLKPEVYDEC